jgi:phenylalanyl-tRNA synthetase alpha chain
MLVDELSQLQTDARKRIELAENPEALETVRIEILGRKGSLATISKDMGKLTPE